MNLIKLLKTKLVKSSGIVLIAMALSSIFMYLFRVIMARNLTIVEYGLFFSINSLLVLVGTFANFGLAETFIKLFTQYRAEKNYPKLKGLIYMVSLSRAAIAFLMTVLCFYAADFLIDFFFKSDDGRVLFLLLVLANMLTSATFNMLHVTYRAMHDMKAWGIMRIFNSFCLVLFTYFGFLLWGSPNVTGAAYILAPFVVFAVYYFYLKKRFTELKGVKAEFSFDEWKRIMSFSLSIILIAVCNFILNTTDTVMLTYFAGLESVAMYQVALPLARIFLTVTTAINIPLLPYLSELYAKKQMDKFRNIFFKLHKYCLLLIIPVILGALMSKYLIWISFGKQYIPAAPALIILLFSMFFMLIFNINLNVLISVGKPRIGNYLMAGGAAINIILNYFFILKWGFVGASIATAVSFLFLGVFGLFYNVFHISSYIPP